MQSITLDPNNLSTSLETLAAALGVIEGENQGVFYMPGESGAGFRINANMGEGISIELIGGPADSRLTSDSYEVYYERGVNSSVFGVRFNVNDVETKLQCAIVPYSSSTGSGHLYIIQLDGYGGGYYFKASGNSGYFENSVSMSNAMRVPTYAIPTTEVVSLAPLVVDDKYTAHALVAYAAPGGGMYATPFTMNGQRYIPLAGNLCIKMD